MARVGGSLPFLCKKIILIFSICLLTFAVYTIIILVYTTKAGDMLHRPVGRPKSESPKDIQLKIRADQSLMDDIAFCCSVLHLTKSDVVRTGIQKVKEEAEKISRDNKTP